MTDKKGKLAAELLLDTPSLLAQSIFLPEDVGV